MQAEELNKLKALAQDAKLEPWDIDPTVLATAVLGLIAEIERLRYAYDGVMADATAQVKDWQNRCGELETRLSSATQELGLLQIEYEYTKRHCDQADKCAHEREAQILDLLSTLQKIRRCPVMPFPDPGAHNWETFGIAVFTAWSDIQRLASQAITPAQAKAVEAKQPAPAAKEKQTVMVGTIGHVDSGKTSLSAAIARTLDSTAIPGTTKESP